MKSVCVLKYCTGTITTKIEILQCSINSLCQHGSVSSTANKTIDKLNNTSHHWHHLYELEQLAASAATWINHQNDDRGSFSHLSPSPYLHPLRGELAEDIFGKLSAPGWTDGSVLEMHEYLSLFTFKHCYNRSNQINRWFSAPPTTRTMTHYIVQFSSSFAVCSMQSGTIML